MKLVFTLHTEDIEQINEEKRLTLAELRFYLRQKNGEISRKYFALKSLNRAY